MQSVAGRQVHADYQPLFYLRAIKTLARKHRKGKPTLVQVGLRRRASSGSFAGINTFNGTQARFCLYIPALKCSGIYPANDYWVAWNRRNWF